MDGAKGPVYTDPDIFENGDFSHFLNNGNVIISLTGHVLYDVRDHVLKISVFVRLDKNDNWAFSKISILGTVFIKLRFWFPCGRKARKEQKVSVF